MTSAPPPYGPPSGTPFGQQSNPYGQQPATPYTGYSGGSELSPYTGPPQGSATSNPYGGYPTAAPGYGGHPYGGMPMPAAPRAAKDMTVAYLLAIFLGGFGAHNFYLGRTGAAVGQLILYVVGIVTSFIFIGLFALLACSIWVIIDLFQIPQWVRAANGHQPGVYGGASPYRQY